MRLILSVSAFLSFVPSAQATMIPQISLERMVGKSESIVTGEVVRSWAAWDPAHQYIWTHTEIRVSSVTKGPAMSTLVVSEPGGIVDGRGLRVEGAVRYTPGEQVLLFVADTPIGFKRTVGWSQGKYLVTPDNRIHSTSSAVEFVPRASAPSETSVRVLDGASLSEFRARVGALIPRIAR